MHRLLQLLGRKGLHDKILGPFPNGLGDEPGLPQRADDHHFGVGIVLHDFGERLDAVDVGHDDIHRHGIGTELLVEIDGLSAVGRLADDQPAGIDKRLGDQTPHHDRIVDNQNGLGHGLLAPHQCQVT